MKQLTINIPDYYYQTFMEYFKHIPDASLFNESSFVLDEAKMSILDRRSQSSEESCMTLEEVTSKLKR